jgi:hypothetical protein
MAAQTFKLYDDFARESFSVPVEAHFEAMAGPDRRQ